MSEVWEGRCTPARRDKERELKLALRCLADPDCSQPPAASPTNTCGQLHEIALCKWQDGVSWGSLSGDVVGHPHGCKITNIMGGGGGISPLHKHHSCSMPPRGRAAPCFGKDLADSRHPLPFPEGPLRCSVDGQSHSCAPSPSVIHRTPREQAVGMLQQASLPTSF